MQLVAGVAGLLQVATRKSKCVATRRELPRCCLRPGGVKLTDKRLNTRVNSPHTAHRAAPYDCPLCFWFLRFSFCPTRCVLDIWTYFIHFEMPILRSVFMVCVIALCQNKNRNNNTKCMILMLHDSVINCRNYFINSTTWLGFVNEYWTVVNKFLRRQLVTFLLSVWVFARFLAVKWRQCCSFWRSRQAGLFALRC